MFGDGRLIIPRTWFRYESGGDVYGEGYSVALRGDVSFTHPHHKQVTLWTYCGYLQHSAFDVDLSELVVFNTSALRFNYLDLAASGLPDRIPLAGQW